MKKLILINYFGIFSDRHEITKIDSRFAVKAFNMCHYECIAIFTKI